MMIEDDESFRDDKSQATTFTNKYDMSIVPPPSHDQSQAGRLSEISQQTFVSEYQISLHEVYQRIISFREKRNIQLIKFSNAITEIQKIVRQRVASIRRELIQLLPQHSLKTDDLIAQIQSIMRELNRQETNRILGGPPVAEEKFNRQLALIQQEFQDIEIECDPRLSSMPQLFLDKQMITFSLNNGFRLKGIEERKSGVIDEQPIDDSGFFQRPYDKNRDSMVNPFQRKKMLSMNELRHFNTRSYSDHLSHLFEHNFAGQARQTTHPNLPSLTEQTQDQYQPFQQMTLIEPCFTDMKVLGFDAKSLNTKKPKINMKTFHRKVSNFASILKDNNLYMTGGEVMNHSRSSSHLVTINKVYKFSSILHASGLEPLNQSRCQHSICSHYFSPIIYVTGGFNSLVANYITKCQSFNIVTKKWEMFENLPEPRAQHASATLGNDAVYIFCGSKEPSHGHDIQFSSDIRKYTPSKDNWMAVQYDSFFHNVPATAHLTAIQLTPGKSIMLFGPGYLERLGRITGQLFVEKKQPRDAEGRVRVKLQIRTQFDDSNKFVPILNTYERPVLIEWVNQSKTVGTVWAFSMKSQETNYSLMRFDFNLEKTDWKWNVAHKKKI